MDTLLSKFSNIVNGVIEGFDRIVFKGMFRPIMHPNGMESFLRSRDILNKDFKEHVMKQSKLIVETAEEISRSQCGEGITFLNSLNDRKEELAHKKQEETGIKNGLIGVWSIVEGCKTFRSTYNPANTYPCLRFDKAKCRHLYFYFDDPTYGFMSARLQTWAPYEIQIALNGREWLRRSLDSNHCEYIVDGNKFLHIDDYTLAQQLLEAQRRANFTEILNGFLPTVFPRMSEIVLDMSYYWILWQSEIARDYIFRSTDDLNPLVNDIMLYGMLSSDGETVMKYFGEPVKLNGQPYAKSNPEILSSARVWFNGGRVRHKSHNNSVKVYNQHNVLRLEMTMNDPTRFMIYRHTEKQDPSQSKKRMPMRKGVADINQRVTVSTNIINRFDQRLSAVEVKTSLGDILSTVSSPLYHCNKKYRALDVFGKDLDLFRAISNQSFDVDPVTNVALQKILIDTPWAKGLSEKQLSARITRHIKLLREHGIIKKVSKQRQYTLTDKGRTLAVASKCALAASINELLKAA